MGALPQIYINGQRVYTLTEASEVLHVARATLRKRVQYRNVQPAGMVDERTPVYYLEDLGSGRAPTEKEKP